MSSKETIQVKQMRKAMAAIDVLAQHPDQESLDAIRRIVEYGTMKRAEVQTRLVVDYVRDTTETKET